MIRINQLKTEVTDDRQVLYRHLAELLDYKSNDLKKVEIIRRSIDARKKPDIQYIYTVDVYLENEEKVYRKLISKRKLKEQITLCKPEIYHFPIAGGRRLQHQPVIIGTGPAGLFCGYLLAKHGYRPILLERGKDVDARSEDVEHFWSTGVLNPASNVQFGEGGAGTFSDGKLNTLVKDKDGRNKEVLAIFVKHGAPEEILYDAKPHIGTDVLKTVVKSMREE
ncbi:MAG: NAD(P)-binding protein, partial [Acetatifactor sp.]|nr:NAD(P)-binding protein [Acetatifactor sp.]